MGAKVIVLNGKTYHSIEEMPPDVREKYELAMCLLDDAERDDAPGTFELGKIFTDRNKNGTPDLLENITADNFMVNSTKIIVDGKEFDRIEDLPPAARARYEEAMSKLDANRNGIPDFVEGMINTTNQTANISTSFAAEAPSRSASAEYPPSARAREGKPLSSDSAITPDTSNGWRLALAGLFILLLCGAGAAGVWYFFLR